MGDWSNAALQTVFWNCANAMRREAKLCDIVLYVQNRHGMMVGYPAHKLLLISTSKYFKLLFEREDLRNSCHFPHLNEDGLICVLDIIYGRDISKGVNLDDALMAARFLQVELAVEALEKKMAEDSFSKDKHLSDVKPATLSKPQSRTNNQQQPANVAEVRLFKNLKVTAAAVEDTKQCVKRRKVGTTPESDSFSDSQLTPDTETNQSQGDIITIKMEPDLNLTADDTGSYQGYDHPLSQMSFTQGGEEMADDGEMQNYGMASTDDIDEQDMSFSNQMTNQGFVADTNSTGSVPDFYMEGYGNWIRQKPKFVRHSWTHEEEEELLGLFSDNFSQSKTPGKKECKAAMLKSEKNGGMIHLHDNWETVKKKVNNMMRRNTRSLNRTSTYSKPQCFSQVSTGHNMPNDFNCAAIKASNRHVVKDSFSNANSG